MYLQECVHFNIFKWLLVIKHLHVCSDSRQRNCLCFGPASGMSADTLCFSCDPVIQLQTPTVVYSEMSSVFTFTPACFQRYSTWCTYSIVLPYCSGEQWEVTGRVTGEVIVSREKMNADWPRRDFLPEACAIEAPAKPSFFKQNKNLFNSCKSSHADKRWRGKRDKLRNMQNRAQSQKGNLKMGLLWNVLNQYMKYKPLKC